MASDKEAGIEKGIAMTTTTQTTRKSHVATALGGAVAALALCVALVGCGAGGAGLAGTWKVADESSGAEMTLELKGDGSAKLSLEGDGTSISSEGTWEETGDGEGTLEMGGSEKDLQLSDDGSQLDFEDIRFDRA